MSLCFISIHWFMTDWGGEEEKSTGRNCFHPMRPKSSSRRMFGSFASQSPELNLNLCISDWSWKGLLTISMQGKMTVLATGSGMETLVLWCDVTWPKVPHWLKIFSLAMQSLLLFYMRGFQMNNLFWCALLSLCCKYTKTLHTHL